MLMLQTLSHIQYEKKNFHRTHLHKNQHYKYEKITDMRKTTFHFLFFSLTLSWKSPKLNKSKLNQQ